MKSKLIGVLFIVLLLSGCATTQKMTYDNTSNIYKKFELLEDRLNEKDKEIEELKYEVKELSSLVNEMDSSYDAGSVEEYIPPSKNIRIARENFKNDDKDEVVRVDVNAFDVQTSLKNAGYYDGKIDGKLGSKTKSAIKSFQRDHELTVDGIIGKRTWSMLKTYLK